jgi:hypothetical protein
MPRHMTLEIHVIVREWHTSVAELSLLSDVQYFCILIDIFFKVIQIEKLYNNFEISLISLTPPHLCAILEQWHGFLRSYVVAFIILRVLRWEMVVWFVDVCGIVDHHFLIFLFIFYNIKVVELNLIWVSFCNVRYDFRIKTNFGSSLPPDVCRRAHVLFTLIVCVCNLKTLSIINATTYDLRNPCHCSRMAHKCGGVKLINEISKLLYNFSIWITLKKISIKMQKYWTSESNDISLFFLLSLHYIMFSFY